MNKELLNRYKVNEQKKNSWISLKLLKEYRIIE